MRQIDSLTAAITGRRQGEAILTWGQHYIWRDTIEPLGVNDCQENGLLRFPIGPATSIDQLVGVVEAAVNQFESLRSLYPRSAGGGPLRQQIIASGSMEVRLYQLDPLFSQQPCNVLAADFRAERFIPGKHLPIRAAILIDALSRPLELLLAVSHLALDGHGATVLIDFIDELLLSGIPPDIVDNSPWAVGIQPIEQVEYERSKLAILQSEKSLGYWRTELARFPKIDTQALNNVTGSPYWRAWVKSDQYAATCLHIARQLKVLPMAACVAAIGSVLAHLRGTADASIMLVCANRITPGSQNSVMNFARAVPISLSVADKSFYELVLATNNVCLRAATKGACDPTAVEDLSLEVAGQGRSIDMSWIVNPRLTSHLHAIDRRRGDATFVRNIAPGNLDSAVFSYRPDPTGQNVSAYFEISDESLQMVASAHLFTPDDAEHLMRCIGRVLVDAALSDFPSSERTSSLLEGTTCSVGAQREV